jgi:hypothetical protein
VLHILLSKCVTLLFEHVVVKIQYEVEPSLLLVALGFR